jgi:hypothetical protein
MTHASKRMAGILLVLLPTIMFGGVSILTLLINDPGIWKTHYARTCGGPAMPMRAHYSFYR